MCGIAGFFGTKSIDKERIAKTLILMKNRGPDFSCSKSFSFGDFNINLLHSRLNIIDLSSRSNQPFFIKDYVLVFNGEIYNYVELRKILKKKNIDLITESDTEILLQFYILFGEKCVDFFEGMWSFVIYDLKKKRFFISRDRFGEKPFYYYNYGKNFFFGSEIKFIHSLINKKNSLNKKMITSFLMNGYRNLFKENSSFFEEIKFLEPGHSMIIEKGIIKKKYSYWKKQARKSVLSLPELIAESKKRIINSLKLRTRSDVPIAFCLSGGVDSAALVSIASKVLNLKFKTYSIIDSDKRYNELENINATIRDTNCENELIELKKNNFLENLKNLIEYHQSPISTISYYVHSLISEKASKQGYKVIISGTGADELFTGYYDHYLFHLAAIRKASSYKNNLRDWKTYIRKEIRNPILKNYELFRNSPEYREHLFDSSNIIKKFLKTGENFFFKEKNIYKDVLKNRLYNELFYEVVPVILYEDDLNSMMNSIENRSPYLDTSLYSLTSSIPTEYFIQKGFNKYILRESMKGILNEKVRLDRKKKGF